MQKGCAAARDADHKYRLANVDFSEVGEEQGIEPKTQPVNHHYEQKYRPENQHNGDALGGELAIGTVLAGEEAVPEKAPE